MKNVVVENFNELAALGESKVRGKIVLFNAKFDERLEAQGAGLEAYGRAVAYRGGGASAAARLGAVAGPIACRTPEPCDTPRARREFPPPRLPTKTPN